jgi:hypothetical protein
MLQHLFRSVIPCGGFRGVVYLGTAALLAACGGSGDSFEALSGTPDAAGGAAGDPMAATDARSELASFTRSDGSGGSAVGSGGTANGGSGDNSSGAGGSGGQGDAGMVADAGRDVCVPSGPGDNLGRNATVNACGNTTCVYNMGYCCAPRGAEAPTCLPSPYGSDKSACLNKGALPITCDEKAKCQHSSVCCGMMGDSGSVAVVSCFEKVDCQAPNLLICGSDADCQLGQRCVARTIYGEKLGVCEAAVTCQ